MNELRRLVYRLSDDELREVENRSRELNYRNKADYFRDRIEALNIIALDNNSIRNSSKKINANGNYINIVAKDVNTKGYSTESDMKMVLDMLDNIENELNLVIDLIEGLGV